MISSSHQPVLLQPAIDNLNIKADGIYIDGTFGRGGHSQAILEQLNESGRLIAIDKDPSAVAVAKERFANDPRFEIVHRSYKDIAEIAKEAGVFGKVDGILLDLGVSSPQLDEADRGFSFMQDGPLDMRMDTSQGQSAAEWIARASDKEIAQVLKEYGEERFAKRIARAIVAARQETPITTTGQLSKIVKEANPKWEQHKHPATRSFQAIRIFINEELSALEPSLEHSVETLAQAGRLVVISFHSLEDRVVKRFMRRLASGELPKGLPVTIEEMNAPLKLVCKAIKPTESEVADNPRARSAVMRVGEKLK